MLNNTMMYNHSANIGKHGGGLRGTHLPPTRTVTVIPTIHNRPQN